MKQKYKVGDVVKIKPAKFFKIFKNRKNIPLFVGPMYRFCGKKYLIDNIFGVNSQYCAYTLKLINPSTSNISTILDIGRYYFSESMFDNMIKKKIEKL